ncbi:MAG: glycoside hydrolase family 66 protein [Christensenellales bacterium]
MADARIACRICRAKGETPMNCRTDKSMYAPNETVCVYVDGLPAETVSLRLILSHLEKTVLTEEIAAAERFSLLPPAKDGKGYLLEVQALDPDKALLADAFTAIDVSSAWTRFPRYGYVWDFTPGVDAQAKIETLCRFHINGLQFYDWQYI